MNTHVYNTIIEKSLSDFGMDCFVYSRVAGMFNIKLKVKS